MKHFYYLFFVLLAGAFTVQAQDTIYFSKEWLVTDQENAAYFSTIRPVPAEPDLFVVKDFTKEGVLLSQCEYQTLQANYDWRNLYQKNFYDFAIEHGNFAEFYPTGQKKKQFEYKDGIQEGLVQVWTETGNPLRNYFAVDHLANGEYKEYFDNGKIHFSVNFRRDTLHGKAVYYHPNGRIAQEGNFKAGKKNGTWKYWSENGTFEQEEVYRESFFIDGPDVNISFPEGKWCFSDRYEENGRMNFLFYRLGIDETAGTGDVPSCTIALETISGNSTLLDYSSFRRRRLSVDVHKVISQEQDLFALENTMGYLASYTDEDKNKHTVVVVHSIQNNIGLELILDATYEEYEKLKKEFVYILRSLKR